MACNRSVITHHNDFTHHVLRCVVNLKFTNYNYKFVVNLYLLQIHTFVWILMQLFVYISARSSTLTTGELVHFVMPLR